MKLWQLDTYETLSLLNYTTLTTTQDCEAYRFQGSQQGWQLVGSLESKGKPGVGGHRDESALNMFKQMDLRGKSKDDSQLKTLHQNTISTLRVFEGAGQNVRRFSSKFSSASMHVGGC